jgi:predicted AlkP superfamily pyrophosphatase or phosphodiesterase
VALSCDSPAKLCTQACPSRSLLIMTAVTVLGALSGISSANELRVKKVLVIGIDGLRPDVLQNEDTPFLNALIKDGAYSSETQVLGQRYRKNDTISGPGWSSFLTGVWADKHGVHNNDFKEPNFKRYPHFFQRLKEKRPAARTASFVSWKPIDEYITSAADVSKVFAVETKVARDWADNEWKLAESAKQYLEQENPDAIFVYFGFLDVIGHNKGFHPSVPEYRSAIAVIDGAIGKVLRGMLARKTYANEDWLVLVSSDHGGKGTTHSQGHDVPEIRTVPLIVSGPSAKRGKIEGPTFLVDVPVTALHHLGVEIDPAWKLDGHAVGLKQSE